MEYKIFTIINKTIHRNTLFRRILSTVLIILGIIVVIIPLPFSVPSGTFLIIIGIILKVSQIKKVKYLIKIKRSIIYMFKNIRRKAILKKKIYDIKKLYKKLEKNTYKK